MKSFDLWCLLYRADLEMKRADLRGADLPAMKSLRIAKEFCNVVLIEQQWLYVQIEDKISRVSNECAETSEAYNRAVKIHAIDPTFPLCLMDGELPIWEEGD